jgi:signal transduction histidine kinase
VPGQSAASGTGLGLAIVRELINAMGGSVSCDSKPGHGATFHLYLPVWRPRE